MSQRKHINIDGKFGKQTSRELQQYLVSKGYQVDVDGIFGKGSITALQQHIGVDSDGIWGYNTTKCLQKFLNETSNSIQIKVDGKRGSETYSALQTFLNEYEYEQNKDNTDEKKVEEEYSTLKKDTKTYTKTCKETEIQVNVKDIARLIENSIKISAGGVSLIGNIGQQIQDTVIHCSWSSTQKNEKIVKHFYEQNVYIYLEVERKILKKSTNIMIFGDKNVEIEAKTKYIYVEAGNDAAKKFLQDITRDQVHDAFDYISKNIDKWNK